MRIQFVEGTRIVTNARPKGIAPKLKVAGMLLALPLIARSPAVVTEKVSWLPIPAIHVMKQQIPSVAEGGPFVNEGCAVQKIKNTSVQGTKDTPLEGETQQSIPVPVQTISLVDQKIASLPAELQTELKDHGWTFQTAPKETLNSMGFGSILAITDYTTKTVYFRDQNSAIEASFYHELGHVLAADRGRCDLSVEFAQCYEAEKDSLIDVHEQGDRHCSINPEEYFATIVDNIFCSGDTYEYSAPKGYAYVRQCLCL